MMVITKEDVQAGAVLLAGSMVTTALIGYTWWMTGGQQWACGQVFDWPFDPSGRTKVVLSNDVCPQRAVEEEIKMRACAANPCDDRGRIRSDCQKYGMKEYVFVITPLDAEGKPRAITQNLHYVWASLPTNRRVDITVQTIVEGCMGPFPYKYVDVEVTNTKWLRIYTSWGHSYKKMRLKSNLRGHITFSPLAMLNPGEGKSVEIPINLYPVDNPERPSSVIIRITGEEKPWVAPCSGCNVDQTWEGSPGDTTWTHH